MFLDAYPVSMDQLRSTLAQYKAANPNLPVVLKGDAATHYQNIMDVLEVAKSLDITEIGLVTKRAPSLMQVHERFQTVRHHQCHADVGSRLRAVGGVHSDDHGIDPGIEHFDA